MNRLYLAFVIGFVFYLVGFSPAHAANFCGMNYTTTADCPILQENAAGEPEFKTVNLPEPIGELKVPSKVYFFSGPLCIAESSIRVAMSSLYTLFFDAFLKPFTAALMLYVLVYAISFMYGLVNPKDFALRLFKIAVVYALVTDNCFFYNNLYGGFIGASNDLIRIMAGVNDPAPAATAADAQKKLYESLDNLFQNVVGIDGLIGLGVFMMASVTSDGQGVPAAVIAALGFGSMAVALLRALVTLGIAFAGISFFLMLTPIFLSFFLFENTKQLFDSWLSLLISFVLQPFIIIAFLVMMRLVIGGDMFAPNNAAAGKAGDLNINNIMQTATGALSSFKFEPQMAQGKPSINVTLPDKDKMAAIGITVDADAGRLEVQKAFFDTFVPKLLFWFVLNMIMAAFIKEVPSIAQRLGGFLSAPALGATQDNAFGTTGNLGITLPGISRGAGGEIGSILGSAMKKNTAVRNFGVAGAMLAGGYMVKDMVDSKTRARDGNDVENKAKDGQANREGSGISRAGTLGELLGKNQAAREGMQVDGIGEKGAASREGPNVTGTGEKGGAARTEPFFAADRAKVIEKQQEAAQYYANKGAEVFAKDLGIKAPKLAKNPTITRNINITVQDIKMTSRGEGSTSYILNGKEIEVKKAEEEAFLRKQIGQIDKDIAKAGAMGANAPKEIEQSAMLRRDMLARLELITSEKNALDKLEKTEKLISGDRTAMKEELQAANDNKRALDKEFAAVTKSKMPQDEKISALKRLSLEQALLQEKIDRLAPLVNADANTATTLRSAAVIVPSLVQQNDIQQLQSERDKIDKLKFSDISGSLRTTQHAMEKQQVVFAEKQALASIELEAARLRTEGQSNTEMQALARDIVAATHAQNVAKLAAINAGLKKRPDTENLKKIISDIEELEKSMTVVSAQRVDTTLVATSIHSIAETDPTERILDLTRPVWGQSAAIKITPEMKAEQEMVAALSDAEQELIRLREREASDAELLRIQNELEVAARERDLKAIDEMIASLKEKQNEEDRLELIASLEELRRTMEATIPPSEPVPIPTIDLSTFADDMKASLGSMINDNVDQNLETNLAPYNLQWTGLTLVPNKTIGGKAIDTIFEKIGADVEPSLAEALKLQYADEIGAALRDAYNNGKKPEEIAEIAMRPFTAGLATAIHSSDTHDDGTHAHIKYHKDQEHRHASAAKTKHYSTDDPRFAGLTPEEIEARIDLEEQQELEEERQEQLAKDQEWEKAREDNLVQNDRANTPEQGNNPVYDNEIATESALASADEVPNIPTSEQAIEEATQELETIPENETVTELEATEELRSTPSNEEKFVIDKTATIEPEPEQFVVADNNSEDAKELSPEGIQEGSPTIEQPIVNEQFAVVDEAAVSEKSEAPEQPAAFIFASDMQQETPEKPLFAEEDIIYSSNNTEKAPSPKEKLATNKTEDSEEDSTSGGDDGGDGPKLPPNKRTKTA